MLLLNACSPDNELFEINKQIPISRIKEIKLRPSHKMILADGRAVLDLRPLIKVDSGYIINDDRVDESLLSFQTTDGKTLSRHFSTSDKSLVDKTIKVFIKLKGTDIVSDTADITIKSPLNLADFDEIVIPVVFHILQTSEEIEYYGGLYTKDRIDLLLNKMNNLFSGSASFNPVGVNTKIRFAYAKYTPEGNLMNEEGINRFISKNIDASELYSDFIEKNNLLWNTKHYMNIWLISDINKEKPYFGYEISEKCAPKYRKLTSEGEEPKGLELSDWTEEIKFKVGESGIRYKLQELDELDRTTPHGISGNNEFAHYLGFYFGLKPTFSLMKGVGDDFCDDTIDYFVDNTNKKNQGWIKEVDKYMFIAENIMDGVKGVHSSISKEQFKRIRWVLSNCPDRFAWKSDFAFTGQNK